MVKFRKKVNKPASNKIIALQRHNVIIERLLSVTKPLDIIGDISQEYGITKESANQLVHKARLNIKGYRDTEIDNIMTLHINRYEYIYSQATILNITTIALASLRAKEELLKMHKEGTYIQVNNNLTGLGLDAPFDLSKLNANQTVRFNELIKKISINEKVA